MFASTIAIYIDIDKGFWFVSLCYNTWVYKRKPLKLSSIKLNWVPWQRMAIANAFFTGEALNQAYFLILTPIGVTGNTLSFMVGYKG